MQSQVKKAIIPAAGLGTRFLPMTKSSPKEMLPIVDKPVIQFVVEEAVESGIEDILIITGRGKRAIENHFDYAPGLEAHLERQGKPEQAGLVRARADGRRRIYRPCPAGLAPLRQWLDGLWDAQLAAFKADAEGSDT